MIKVIKTYFNYFFYRAYCFYVKYKDDDAVFMAVMILAMFQVLWVIVLFGILDHAIREDRHAKQTHQMIRMGIAISTVIVIYVNYKLFRKVDINDLMQKWDSEPIESRRRKGWLLVLLLILPLFCMIGYAVLKHNFKVIQIIILTTR